MRQLIQLVLSRLALALAQIQPDFCLGSKTSSLAKESQNGEKALKHHYVTIEN